MKKRSTLMISLLSAVVAAFALFAVGCAGGEGGDPKKHTIQYTDDAGTHLITVTDGMPYSLDALPTRSGYIFEGLFDAETGGTQYVSESGASLSPFTDKKNLVLFPRFRAREFTVILDYGGAAVTGGRQYTVAYDSSLPELPKNLTLEHKVFAGWYTGENRGGTRVADAYGLIPVVSVLNDTSFDISSDRIYLYAGFETEKFTVTCCFETGMETEDVQVEYDTPVGRIVPETRVDGNAPLTWSKTRGGEVWNGRITEDTVLYAVEYAPVIEFDTDGGDGVSPVVARAGSTVTLPEPTKELSKFVGWADMQGNAFTSTAMPSKSISLKAVWQAKLVFDSNGGSAVKDVSQAAGSSVTLPVPERDGYIFAGWYDTESDPYTSTVMPAAGIKLKAGWYKEKKLTKIYVAADKVQSVESALDPVTQEIDMKKYDPDNDFEGALNIELKIYFKTQHYVSGMGFSGYADMRYGIYSESKRSTSTTLFETTCEHNSLKTFQQRQYTVTVNVENGVFYIIYNYASNSAFRGVDINDYYIEYRYPDTARLYL